MPAGSELTKLITRLLKEEFEFMQLRWLEVKYRPPRAITVRLNCDKDVYVYYNITVERTLTEPASPPPDLEPSHGGNKAP